MEQANVIDGVETENGQAGEGRGALSRIFGMFCQEDRLYEVIRFGMKGASKGLSAVLGVLNRPGCHADLSMVIEMRGKGRHFAGEVEEQMDNTFMAPMDKGDIGRLSNAIQGLFKSIEKAGMDLVVYRETLKNADFSTHPELVKECMDEAARMLDSLCDHSELQSVIEQKYRMDELEQKEDELMLELCGRMHAGENDFARVLMIMEVHKRLGDITQACRHTGDVILQIVLARS